MEGGNAERTVQRKGGEEEFVGINWVFLTQPEDGKVSIVSTLGECVCVCLCSVYHLKKKTFTLGISRLPHNKKTSYPIMDSFLGSHVPQLCVRWECHWAAFSFFSLPVQRQTVCTFQTTLRLSKWGRITHDLSLSQTFIRDCSLKDTAQHKCLRELWSQ